MHPGPNPFPDAYAGAESPLLDVFPLKPMGSAPAEPGETLFSVCSCAPGTSAPTGYAWMAFRSFLGLASREDVRPAIRALALAQWRLTTRFCGRCGAPQSDKPDETARLCPSCGLVTYPRLSPAVLALVHKGDLILLAHNAAFRGGMFSILAGFVEPGECFEECLAREVAEEVGIRVKNIRYAGSQPWPFPDSLMVGFEADWESGDLAPDGVEILEADWYGKDDHPPLPLPGSLSRRLIDGAWGLEGPAPCGL
jgi:NAD+ diphosphatase